MGRFGVSTHPCTDAYEFRSRRKATIRPSAADPNRRNAIPRTASTTAFWMPVYAAPPYAMSCALTRRTIANMTAAIAQMIAMTRDAEGDGVTLSGSEVTSAPGKGSLIPGTYSPTWVAAYSACSGVNLLPYADVSCATSEACEKPLPIARYPFAASTA